MTDNTITGLRIQQWGIEGVKASGTLTVDTLPTANDTMTIGPKVYTFKAVAAVDGEIAIAAGDLATTKTNIVAAINGSSGPNDPNPVATAAAFIGDDCVITARLPGTGGNAIVSTETFTAGTNVFDAAVLGTTVAGSHARGTAVAATSKIAIETLEWSDDEEVLYRPKFAIGVLMRNRGLGTPMKHGTGFSWSGQPVPWEQLPHFLSMAIEGNPTVTYVGGSPDVYRWVFTRDPAANPQCNSFTLQRRFSNGTNNVDQRAAYAMLKEWALSFADGEPLRHDGSGFARKFETSAITGALSLPTTEIAASALSKIYLDDTWGAVGGTLLAEQVIGWKLAMGTGLLPRDTAEGRTDLDFTKHQYNADEVMLSLALTCLMDPTTYAAEEAKAEAGSLRAVRVQVAGSGGRLLKIDGLFQYTKGALFKIGEQDGQDIVELELEEATDNTNFLSATFEHPSVNDLD
jgi:hypothetical protein